MQRFAFAMVIGLLACGGGGDVAPLDEGVVGDQSPAETAVDVPQGETAADVPTDAVVDADTGAPAPLVVECGGYKGAYAGVDSAEIRLFLQDAKGAPRCDGLTIDDVTGMSAVVVSPKVAIDSAYQFATLPGLEADKSQTYTVVGLASSGQGPAQAMACDDKGGTVEWGGQTHLSLAWIDLHPRAAGTYDETTVLDLATDLPSAAAARLAGIAAFVEDPAGESLRTACLAAGTKGELADFCAVMFANKDDPALTGLTDLGTKVHAMIKQNTPAGMTAADARAALVVRLSATLTIGAAFDAVGLCGDPSCHESWTTLHVQVPGGTQTNIPIGPIEVGPELQRKGLAGLFVVGHDVDLKYGYLADFALEKAILPARFGGGTPEVATFEAAIGAVMGKKACLSDGSCCSAFAHAANKAEPAYPESFFMDSCLALVEEGGAWLRDRIVGLDTAGKALSIGSVNPCPMSDTTGDMIIDAIGSAAQPCPMDAGFGVGTESFVPKASLFGTRL